MNQNEKTRSMGITFMEALFLLFLGLKLTGHVDWSWFWVLSPVWIPAVFVIVLLCLAFGAHMLDRRSKR